MVPYTADHFLVQEASFRYLRKLLAAGASVYQYKNGFYHAKTIVIDDKICDIGTANFDKRSLFLNKEINCFLYDPAFIKRVKAVIETDIRDAERLTLAELNKANLYRSVKEGLAGAISYFL
jgi:cardiolipin synthase